MANNAYKKLSKEQMEYISKPVDHKSLCSAIQKKHGATMRFVRDKYQGDAKPVFIDKGSV